MNKVGQIIQHYKILEKLGEGSMFENHPRAFCATGGDFQNPPKPSEGGGVS